MSTHLQIKEYHRPRDIARAIEILSRYGKKARLIAGGTDILPQRPGTKHLDTIDHLVDISQLELNYIKINDEHSQIGAATPINTIGTFPLFLSEPFQALSDAAAMPPAASIRAIGA